MTALASSVSILVLDAGGTPRRWIGVEEAVAYYCKEQVAWDYGEHSFTLRGGNSRATRQQTSLTLPSIEAVRADREHRAPLAPTPP